MHRVLSGIIKSQRLAAAYLFAGPPDSAKNEAAQAFAEQLGCGKFDKVTVRPDGATLKIDQVLDVQKRVRFGPTASDQLVVIVETADKMTPEAAGAFLKTLEEPPPRVIFILTVDREERLPATIVSRCQRIIFGESQQGWEPKPELEEFYLGLSRAAGQGLPALLSFSARLEKEKERLEEIIYELAFFAKEKMNDNRLVRIWLAAAKNLKRKANPKLALDVACLQMGEK